MSDLATETVLFEAHLVPHRSLGSKGAWYLLGAVLGMGAVTSVLGAVLLAWPVVVASVMASGMGSVLIASALFRRPGVEHLSLTESAIVVSSQSPGGEVRRRTTLPSAWLQVQLQEDPAGAGALHLRSAGRAVEIARALGAAEKRSLHDALQGALRIMRTAHHLRE